MYTLHFAKSGMFPWRPISYLTNSSTQSLAYSDLQRKKIMCETETECTKDVPPTEVHDDFIKTFGDEFSYSTVKKFAAVFRRV